jgi:hypothetical protein
MPATMRKAVVSRSWRSEQDHELAITNVEREVGQHGDPIEKLDHRAKQTLKVVDTVSRTHH